MKAYVFLAAMQLGLILMEDHRLIFFSDGATCIRDNIKKEIAGNYHSAWLISPNFPQFLSLSNR